MIQIEGRIGQGGSTPRLHQNTLRRESFYGGELGSTDVDRGE